MGHYERQRLRGLQGTDRPAHFWTNAPEAYDYNYVKTVRTISGKHHGPWRYIEVTDRDRFKNFQTPRYGSGMYIVVVPALQAYSHSASVGKRYLRPSFALRRRQYSVASSQFT